MSKESVQFALMARSAPIKSNQQKSRIYPPQIMYCEKCKINTLHTLHESGDWEYYDCTECGATQSYKVR